MVIHRVGPVKTHVRQRAPRLKVLTLLEEQLAKLGGEEAQRVEAPRLLGQERLQRRLTPGPERIVQRGMQKALQLGRLIDRRVLSCEAGLDMSSR